MTAMLLALGLKSLLVAALALFALRLTRSRSAAERSTIAHLGLFALVALPIASLWLPALPVTLPEALASPVAAVAPVEETSPLTEPARRTAPAVDTQVAPATGGAQNVPEPAAPLANSPSIGERAAFFARYAYALPALALLLLTFIAVMRLVALRARAEVLVDPHWLGALGRAQRRMSFKNGTALLTSSDLHSPVSWGLLRPTIVINENALEAGEQAEAIIAHELAHVIQLDWAKLMLSRVATAVFWFNPLAWVLAREAHQLREEAADDAVLAADIAGTDYAQLLVGVARHENKGLLLGAHGVAPARNSLRRRVARVLDKTPARGPSGRSWVAGFTAGMLVMAAPLAALSMVPARAKDGASTQVAQITAAPAASWSTRAGDGPNQTGAPAAIRQGHRDVDAALANAVYSLHDEPRAATLAAPTEADGASAESLIPGTAEFAAAWANYGRAIGERFTRAFVANPVPPAPPARTILNGPGRSPNDKADFDYGAFAAAWRDGKGKTWSQDANIGLRPDYRKEMAEVGFANATSQELLRAQSLGVNGDYVQDMRKAGVNETLATYGQARAHGVSASFIESLREAGINASIGDYIRARDFGVTGQYVETLRDAGITGTLNDFIEARTTGITSTYVRAMKAVGVTGSIADYQQMRDAGVNSRFVQALHDNGNAVTSPRKLIELKNSGYNPYDRRSSDP